MPLDVRIAQSEEYSQIDELLPSAFDANAKVLVTAHRADKLVGTGSLEALPRPGAGAYLRIDLATKSAPEREAVRKVLLEHLLELAAEWDAVGVVLGELSASEGAGATRKRQLGFEPIEALDTWTIETTRLANELDSVPMNARPDWESRQPRAEDQSTINALLAGQTKRPSQMCMHILQMPALARVLVERDSDDSNRITGVLSVRPVQESFIPIDAWEDPEHSREKVRFLLTDVLPSWRRQQIESLEFNVLADDEHSPLLKIAQEAGAQCAHRRSRWIKAFADPPNIE